MNRGVASVDVAGGGPGAAVEHDGLPRAGGIEIRKRAGGGEGARGEGIELARVESLNGERSTGEVDRATEGGVVASVPRATGVEVEGLARGVGVVGEAPGGVEGAGGEGEVGGVEGTDGERGAVLQGGVTGVDVAGRRPTAAVEDDRLVGGKGVQVGERTGGVEGAGGEGSELAGVEGLHVERTAGEIDGAVECRVVASVPRATGVKVESLTGGVGVIGQAPGGVEGAGGE